jgi:glycosyltransferase involved in cell wall biosynthesis
VRILVFTTWFPDAAAPATAPFNLNHVRAIASRHDVRVIHVRLGGNGPVVAEDFGGVHVTRIPLSPRRPGSFATVARHTLKALRSADVLHTMAFTSAAVAAPLHALRRVPWVHTEHWSGLAEPATVSRLWAAFAWMRYVLKFPSAVTAVSSAQADQLRPFTRHGAVSVVPNVVQAHGAPAARTGAADGVTRLVGVGGLIERKRPRLAVDAVGLLRAGGLDASLTWVGDGPLRAELEAAADGNLTVTGLVAPERVEEELRRADVFILPTSHETFCVSAAEAVAAGLPAVVTDLPAVRDFLTPENSVLVSGSTAADFAAGVREALDRFAEVPSARIAATIGDNLGPGAVADAFDTIYADITTKEVAAA